MAKKASQKPKAKTAAPAPVSPAVAQTALAAGAARRQAEEARRLLDASMHSLRHAADAMKSVQSTAKADPAAAAIFAQYGLSEDALNVFHSLTSPMFLSFPIV